jgi:hypothetical protein
MKYLVCSKRASYDIIYKSKLRANCGEFYKLLNQLKIDMFYGETCKKLFVL